MTRRTTSGTYVAAIAVVALVLFSATVSTQADHHSSDFAREAYAKGEALFKSGHYEAAQVQFEAAYEASPNPVVLLSVAKTQEKRGDIHGAAVTLERYLAERPDAPDKDQVQQQLQQLKNTKAIVEINSEPAGATIFIDGLQQSQKTPAKIELAPGDHEIELQHEGHQSERKTVTLRYADRIPVTMTLRAKPAPSAAIGTGDDLEEPANLMPWVWTSVGVSGAALVAGTVLGILALNTQSSFNDNPTTARADRGENLALFSDLSFGLALAAGITSLILYLEHRDTHAEYEESERARALQSRLEFIPVVSADQASMHARLTF